MPLLRFQAALVSTPPQDQAVDHIVNTFYLFDSGVTTDVQGLTQDAADLWATYRGYPTGIASVLVRAYQMDDPLPRLPRGEATATITAAPDPMAPREVALCLSYFAGTNVPRKRGRMYVGPWSRTQMAIRPIAGDRDQLVALANGIAGLGGLDVDWVQYSPTAAAHSTVSDFWIDDEWDTVRSRGLVPTARTTGTVSEG